MSTSNCSRCKQGSPCENIKRTEKYIINHCHVSHMIQNAVKGLYFKGTSTEIANIVYIRHKNIFRIINLNFKIFVRGLNHLQPFPKSVLMSSIFGTMIEMSMKRILKIKIFPAWQLKCFEHKFNFIRHAWKFSTILILVFKSITTDSTFV